MKSLRRHSLIFALALIICAAFPAFADKPLSGLDIQILAYDSASEPAPAAADDVISGYNASDQLAEVETETTRRWCSADSLSATEVAATLIERYDKLSIYQS